MNEAGQTGRIYSKQGHSTLNTYTHFPEPYYTLLGPGTVLLQTSRFDAENYRSYLFCDPARVLTAGRLEEVPCVFAHAQEALAGGAYVAGFVSYECGQHFERVGEELTSGAPLAWFGVYQRAYIFDHRCGEFVNRAPEGIADADELRRGGRSYDFGAHHARLEIARHEYERKLETIRDYIRAGDTYQVNFTDRVSFEFAGSPVGLFSALQQRQRVAYSAYIDTGETAPPCLSKGGRDKGGPPRDSGRDTEGPSTKTARDEDVAGAGGVQILSFSPELFFRVRDGQITTRPMKGTVRRGHDSDEDIALAGWLPNDEKNRAENVMIVDLLRNDLGRICEFGSVRVDELCAVEQYETLWQMTSTISGKLRPGLSYYDVFKGLFPCGSVTGAPKVRSMQIIRELERGPRGVYTGAIGFMSPGGEAVFNVPIRTVTLQGRRGEMGVGSGIVFDSTAEQEYRECLLKAEFLTSSGANTPTLRFAQDGAPGDTEPGATADAPFHLLESILWDGSAYPWLRLHLERLQKSAAQLGFVLNCDVVLRQIENNSKALGRGVCYKVRLLLDKTGAVTIENTALQGNGVIGNVIGNVALAEVRTSSDDSLLQHKTTRRQLYDRMYQQARERGLDEVVFMNERGEITEGAISNVFVQAGARLYTPPVECGLLPGVYRRHMLETNAAAGEKVLRLADLQTADAIYICNAVRGLRRVELNCVLAP